MSGAVQINLFETVRIAAGGGRTVGECVVVRVTCCPIARDEAMR